MDEGVSPDWHLFHFLDPISEIIKYEIQMIFVSLPRHHPVPLFYRRENRHRIKEKALRGRVRIRIPASSQHQAPPPRQSISGQCAGDRQRPDAD